MLSFSEKDCDDLMSWGINMVRLGVMWPGVEPQLGQYNATYLQQMVQLVNWLGQRGIYTLIDFHQGPFAVILRILRVRFSFCLCGCVS